MTEPLPSPAASSRYVLDRDGDLWQSAGGGRWRCLTATSCLTAGADLINVCGPLTELFAREVMAAEVEAKAAAAEHAWRTGPSRLASERERSKYTVAGMRIAARQIREGKS